MSAKANSGHSAIHSITPSVARPLNGGWQRIHNRYDDARTYSAICSLPRCLLAKEMPDQHAPSELSLSGLGREF